MMKVILSTRGIMTAAMIVGLAAEARASSVTVGFSGTFAGTGNGTFSGTFEIPTVVVSKTYTPITVFSVNLSAYPALDFGSTSKVPNSDDSNLTVSRTTGTAEVLLENAENTESLTMFFNIDGSGSINFGSSPPPSIEANVSSFTASPVADPPHGLTIKIASGEAFAVPEPSSFALACVGALGTLALAKARRSGLVA